MKTEYVVQRLTEQDNYERFWVDVRVTKSLEDQDEAMSMLKQAVEFNSFPEIRKLDACIKKWRLIRRITPESGGEPNEAVIETVDVKPAI